MKNRLSRFFVLLCLSLWQCSPSPLYDKNPEEGKYSLNQLRSVGCYDLDKAIRYVKEGQAKGELSAYDAADLCAYLTYQLSFDYAKVIDYCNQAVAALEASENKDPVLWVRSLGLLCRAAYDNDDLFTCLEKSSEGSEIAHEHDYLFGDAALDFMVGRCQYDCGLYVDGILHMNDALERAIRTVKSEREYETLVYLVLCLYNCYFVEDDFEEMLRVVNLLEPLLNDLGQKFPGMKDNCSLSNYYRCQYFLHLGRAVSKASLGHLTEAKADFDCCRDMDYASWNGNDRFQIDYYMAIGAVDSVERITQRYPYRQEDTLNWSYQMRIARLERAYRISGDMITADSLAFCMDTLAGLIEKMELENGLGVMATQYSSKHYQLSLSSLTETVKKQHIADMLLLVCFFLVIVGCLLMIFFFNRNRKKDKAAFQQKSQTMEEEVEKLRKQVRLIVRKDTKLKAEEGEVEPATLAAFVEKNELYLKKDISRALVAELMGCTQRAMTKMLDEIHPGLSFPDYIRSLRIRHALKAINENPNIMVQQLAEDSGFYSISSFERAFKAVMGKTPKAYLKEKAESHVDDDQNEESRPQSGDGSQS